MATKLSVTQNPDAPVEKNILAQAIVDIAGAAKKLQQSGINKDAIVILVSVRSGYPRTAVRDVIDSLAVLERDFCR